MNNFSLPGIKKMAFSDYMNNNNYIQDQTPGIESVTTEPYQTLNSMRTERAFQAQPESFSFDAGAEPTLMPDVKMDEIPKTVGDVLKPAGTPVSTPKPETKSTGLKAIVEKIGGTKPASVFGTKEIFAGLKADEFATLAGALAHAIAPDTAQGRAGAAISAIAGKDLETRRKAELESPEKMLAARLTEAKIANLEKSDDPKTAMAWYLKNNPNASAEDVTAFKKGLETDTAGSYWRTTSDDGTVSIYKGGELIHQSAPGIGKTKEEKMYATQEKGFVPAKEAKGLTKAKTKAEATPVSWTTATKSLSSRFGKQDALGNIIITPDLQNAHRVAQKKLVDLQKSGMEPLDAINKAEDFARHVEDRYWVYFGNIEKSDIGRADKDKKKADLNKSFKNSYGYIPKVRR